MSREGQLRRGEEYFRMRDVNGIYPPGVMNNPNKREELEIYLNSLKEKEEKPIKKKEAK